MVTKTKKQLEEEERARQQRAAEKRELADTERIRTRREISGPDRLELARSRARKAQIPEPTGIDPEGQFIQAPELVAQQEEARKEVLPEQLGPGLEKQFEEAGVFKEVVQEPIISPEKENLGVIKGIATALLPKRFLSGLSDLDKFFNPADLGEAARQISQAEIEIQNEAIKQSFQEATSEGIDENIEDVQVLQNSIGLGSVAVGIGALAIGQAVTAPIAEFIGTDGQIRSLELALSQYNEMVTLPARGMDSGLTSEQAFDKLNRMEDGIAELESLLKQAAITSTKVRISLRGRGVDARLLKLKEKIQDSRRTVAQKTAAQAFEEVDVPKSITFLQDLQRKRKKRGKTPQEVFGLR